MNSPIYLDYNATTPVAPEVSAAMRPWIEKQFGNPSSSHIYGQRARQAVAQARESVAALIGAQADEIVFTGSATEANNLALLGIARAMAHANGTLVHTDAAQSAGKVELDVAALGIDLLTLAGHKFYGPKGIGALYVRRGTALKPILFGADQEHGLRPGTENVAQIVGAGETARLARSRLPHATRHLAALRGELHRRLAEGVPGLLQNGHPQQRLPNTLHVSFPGVSGRDLLAAAPEVAASVGSACHSDADAVSGVLAAMGCDPVRARGAVRLSVGFPTTAKDVEAAASSLARAWRAVAP